MFWSLHEYINQIVWEPKESHLHPHPTILIFVLGWQSYLLHGLSHWKCSFLFQMPLRETIPMHWRFNCCWIFTKPHLMKVFHTMKCNRHVWRPKSKNRTLLWRYRWPPLDFQTITTISSDINFISSEMLSWEKIERETLIYNIWRHLLVQC